MTQPHVVGIGGTVRLNSSTGRALAAALRLAEARGARTTLLTGDEIDFPNFDPEAGGDAPQVAAFVEAIRSADAVVIGSPGYHGSFSGLVKNALDHVELTARDDRAYFTDLPVGVIATAAGWQAAVTTLAGLRGARAWSTPCADGRRRSGSRSTPRTPTPSPAPSRRSRRWSTRSSHS
jgi:FMN reductase